MFYCQHAPSTAFTEVVRRETAGARLTWRLRPARADLFLAGLRPSQKFPGFRQLGRLWRRHDGRDQPLSQRSLYFDRIDQDGVLAFETIEPLKLWVPRNRVYDSISNFNAWFDKHFGWCGKTPTAVSHFGKLHENLLPPLCCVQRNESDWEFAARLIDIVATQRRVPLFLVGAVANNESKESWRVVGCDKLETANGSWHEAAAVSSDDPGPLTQAGSFVGMRRFVQVRSPFDPERWNRPNVIEQLPFKPVDGFCAVEREDVLRDEHDAWEVRTACIPCQGLFERWRRIFPSRGVVGHTLFGRVESFQAERWQIICRVDEFDDKYNTVSAQVETLDPGSDGTSGWHVVPSSKAEATVYCEDLSRSCPRPMHRSTNRSWTQRDRGKLDSRSLEGPSITDDSVTLRSNSGRSLKVKDTIDFA